MTRQSRRMVVASLYALLFCLVRPCAAFPVPSENVTVLLFRTEAVQRLQVRARNVRVQRCTTCNAERGPLSLDLELRGGRMVNAKGIPVGSLVITGEAALATAGGQHASAAGTWTIDGAGDGFRVRVTVSRERYVEAVLAAEAGPQQPEESLKALAVVARSFAAASHGRHENNALCDTTHCQAVRLAPVPPALRDAVWATSRETLWFAGKQVSGYFSQHCGGFTEDAAAVWGGPKLPWLSAHLDPWCARVPSQWHASLLEAEVRRALAAEGFALSGAIREVAIIGRDRSGRVQQLRLHTGSEARTVPAATLRFALNRSLGWNQLRSDRYQVRRIGDRIVFEGTGFGHGVGLCQAGAAEMARSGKSYREILQAYFPRAALRIRADDAGWITTPQEGFLLRSVTRNAVVQREAVQAFRDARSRWGSASAATPMLTIFPSTEAFRQATGQSGWELAVTQGGRIATQPAAILQAHGGALAVFRHEFLHSFVEAEASPSAPLWLREGMVSVLNGEACSAEPTMPANMIEAKLRAPGSLLESQQAHAAACARTQQLIAQRGMAVARGILQHP